MDVSEQAVTKKLLELSKVCSAHTDNENDNSTLVAKPLQFTCGICLELLPKRDLLVRHVFIHHSHIEIPSYICQECGLVFLDVPTLYSHMSDHNSKLSLKGQSLYGLACAVCTQPFLFWCCLTEHMFSHVSGVSFSSHVCPHCSEVFEDFTKFQLHKCASQSSHINSTSSVTRFGPVCRRNIKIYKQRLVATEFGLKSTENKTTEIYRCYGLKNKWTHKTCHSCEQSFSCDVSEKSLTLPAHVKSSNKIPTDDRSTYCEVCSKSFVDRWVLQVHKRIHLGERPYSCEVCGKSFTYSNALKKHARIHTGEKPYHCEVCGKQFRDSSSLGIHKRTHTGERPFNCEVCGKMFRYLAIFKTHKRLHSGEKPYSCGVCGKSYTSARSLRAHELTHLSQLPFECEVCFKSFVGRGDLKRHNRIHTGECPFSCDICGKSYKSTNTLQIHKRYHSGERPFGCEVCGKAFVSTADLKKHQRIHLR